jgi:hypothetical protein
LKSKIELLRIRCYCKVLLINRNKKEKSLWEKLT